MPWPTVRCGGDQARRGRVGHDDNGDPSEGWWAQPVEARGLHVLIHRVYCRFSEVSVFKRVLGLLLYSNISGAARYHDREAVASSWPTHLRYVNTDSVS